MSGVTSILGIMRIENEIEQRGNAKVIGHFTNGSPEWLEARAGIGGSDIGTIMGVNPYKSRADLMEERLNPPARPMVPSMPMKLGTALEDGIRNLWASENAGWLQVHETGTWQSLENPFWKANPDGIIEWHDGNLEILEIKYSMRGKLPEAWIHQVNWYCLLLGLEQGIIVQCSGPKLLEHKVRADTALQAEMKKAAKKFEREWRKLNGVR